MQNSIYNVPKGKSLPQAGKGTMKTILTIVTILFCLAGLNGCTFFNALGDMETPASMKIEWPSWFKTKIPSPWASSVEIPNSNDGLRRVAMIVYEDISQQRPPEIKDYIGHNLPTLLSQNCRNLILPGGLNSPVLSPDALPRLITGDIDNYALADAGRSLGLNTIILVRLMQVNSVNKYSGYMWWRDSRYYVTFDVRIEIYDTVSAVKLVDGSGFRQVEIDENLYIIIQQNGGKVNMNLLMPEFDDFVQFEMSPAICAAVTMIPWQAGIRGNGQKTHRISGAGQVGLLPGDALDIHAHGYVIQGIAGERFWYQGPVTGLARVVEVNAEYVEIEILEGSTRFDFAVVSKKLN